MSTTQDKIYKGVIIEESLENKDVLKEVKITETKIVPVTPKHKTPWVKQWTLHTVEVPESQALGLAEKLSQSLDSKHSWYSDFKTDQIHYIIFYQKVFKINRSPEEYNKAQQYGASLGIPDYQLDFSPEIK